MRSTRGHGGTMRLAIAAAPLSSLDHAATAARGHVLRKVDGPSDLAFSYDICERLITVTDHATSQLLKAFTYATANGAGDCMGARPNDYANVWRAFSRRTCGTRICRIAVAGEGGTAG